MRKVGFEIEGRMRGEEVFTFFCDAGTFSNLVYRDELFALLHKHECVHINIYDVQNDLDLEEVSDYFLGTGILVSVELTELREVAPANIEIFWNVSRASYEQCRTIQYLRAKDQVKVENELNVFVWQAIDADITQPEEFEADVEV